MNNDQHFNYFVASFIASHEKNEIFIELCNIKVFFVVIFIILFYLKSSLTNFRNVYQCICSLNVYV